MARKPLIPAGTFLPGRDSSAPPDLIANVIARDRERSGRTAPAVTETAPEPDDSQDDAPAAPAPIVEEAAVPVPAPVANTPRRERPAVADAAKPSKKTPAPPADPKASAWRAARRRAMSASLPITLRAPEDLNDYLDQLAHDLRKHKVKKQELVSLAIQLLYVEAETGGDILALMGRRREPDFDEDEDE